MKRFKIIFTMLSVLLCIIALIFLIKIKKHTFVTRGAALYIFAYPLVLMDLTRQVMTKNGRYKNTFIHANEFPDASFKNIVRPNVDTLYSFAWLDLTEPLVLSIPAVEDRYYLIECLDAWTNVFASIGTRTTGRQAQQFIFVGPNFDKIFPDNMTIITAPTTMVLLLGRTQTNGPQDYAAVHRIQEGYTIAPLSSINKKSISAPIFVSNSNGEQKREPAKEILEMDGVAFYSAFERLMQKNPPAAVDAPFLSKVNVTPDIIALYELSRKKAFNKMLSKKSALPKINGWTMMLDIGTYGIDYGLRALVASLGIGANLPQDAVYPTAFVDQHNQLLDGRNMYRIHFTKGSLPPVRAFWSITLYNNDNFLVSNSLNRYALNDRSPYYINEDGSIDIYIQHRAPEKKYENNWLPAPLEPFNLTLRMYWPQEAVLTGQWQPPAIEKIS